MAKNSLPPRFKVQKVAPMAVAAQKIAKVGRFRGSPSDRGYGYKWDRLSIAYRKRHPFCSWCAMMDPPRDTLADLVDHIIPVQDRPEMVLEWRNLQSLCASCHGRKYSLEVYCRDNDLLHMLPTWCKDRELRPPQFR